MKKILAIVCALALLVSVGVAGLTIPATAADASSIGWIADFSAANQANWEVNNHTNADKGTLAGSTWVNVPTNVSADGASATVSAKVADNAALFGYKVEADFAKYNKVVIKGSYTGDFTAARAGLHNGADMHANWAGTSTVNVNTLENKALNDDGSFFWIVDASAFAGQAHMWFQMGFFLGNGTAWNIEYAILADDTVTDEASADAAVADYLGIEEKAPEAGWIADFSADNQANWEVNNHTNADKGTLAGSTWIWEPTNVSADGASATVAAKVADNAALFGYKVEADFAKYNKVVIKGSYTGDFTAARGSLHNGAEMHSNWVTTQSVEVGYVAANTLNDDGSFFWIVDASAFAGQPHMWFQMGFFLGNGTAWNIEYAALVANVTDEASADAAVAAYLAANAPEAPESSEEESSEPEVSEEESSEPEVSEEESSEPEVSEEESSEPEVSEEESSEPEVYEPIPANGQVGWMANFLQSNNDAWMSDVHDIWGDKFQGKLYNCPMMWDPTNVSEDGYSATIQAKHNGVAITGAAVKADFATYNKLVLKGTYNGDWSAFRASAHNGAHVTSNWRDTVTAVAIKDGITVNDDGTFFGIIDLSVSFVGSEQFWVTFGWFLNNTATIDFDYIALTTGTVTDEATADAAVAKYLAGEQYVDEGPAIPDDLITDTVTFESAVDTKQAFISGAMRVELSSSSIAALNAADTTISLTDGTNTLTWSLKDYTLADGKVNTLLLPFTEATNATIFSNELTKLNLAAVTGVTIASTGYEGELTVELGDVDFVNFVELLDSVGIVFYDSASIQSVTNHGVVDVEGATGGAYQLSNDVDACEYVDDKGVAEWARRFGADGETFSFNAESRKRLNVDFRVKMSEGGYDRFFIQLCSFTADGSYAAQNWAICFHPEDSIYDLTDGWITLSSADEDDMDAWTFGGDQICDLTRLLDMRLLGFRNPSVGDPNTGTVWVDYIMITDSDRYEGMDNLYLYATANADGSDYVCYFAAESEDDESSDDESNDDESSAPSTGDESDDESSTPSTGDESDDETSDNEPSDDASSDDENDNPETGVALPMAAIALLTTAAGAVVISRKKK